MNIGPRPPPRRASVGGIVLNAIAIAAAVAAAPYLLVPLLKLGFVGLLAAAPVALALYAVGFVVIDLGPIAGVITSSIGVARWLGYVTGPLSLVSLGALLAVVAALKTQIDLDMPGTG